MLEDLLKKVLKDLSSEEKAQVESEINSKEPVVEKDNEKVDEKVNEKVEETENSKDETKVVEKSAEETTDVSNQEEGNDMAVTETEESGNGIRVEDVVTKDMLTERLQAFEAKFDAVVKENEDLKDKLAGMQEKYEDNDFGNAQKKGIVEKDNDANDTFEAYSKEFL